MAKTTRRKTTKTGKTTRKKTSGSAARSRSGKTTATKKKTSRASKKTTRAKATTKKKAKAKTTSKKSARGMTNKKSVTTKKKKTATKSKTSPKAVSSKEKTTTKKAKSESKSAAVKKKTSSKISKKPRSVAEVASAVTADEKGYVFINGRRVRMISTRGIVPTKKTRPAAAEPIPAAEDPEPAKPLKTRLSKKELNHYRNLLLIKRSEIVGDLDAMEAAALRSSGGDVSHMPIHMADIGTDTYDQDFTLGLAEAERRQLREIDEALQRIEDKTYGVCFMTGKDIPKARLDAKPWAKYTIEAARLVESQSSDHR